MYRLLSNLVVEEGLLASSLGSSGSGILAGSGALEGGSLGGGPAGSAGESVLALSLSTRMTMLSSGGIVFLP